MAELYSIEPLLEIYCTAIKPLSNHCRTTIEHLLQHFQPLSNIYCTTFKPLSNHCRTTIELSSNYYRTSIIPLSSHYRTTKHLLYQNHIENLLNHYRTSIELLLDIYRITIERLSNYYWTSIVPLSNHYWTFQFQPLLNHIKHLSNRTSIEILLDIYCTTIEWLLNVYRIALNIHRTFINPLFEPLSNICRITFNDSWMISIFFFKVVLWFADMVCNRQNWLRRVSTCDSTEITTTFSLLFMSWASLDCVTQEGK